MENDPRGYQPVQVDLIGIERGLERFTRDGVTELPPVALWRNNLTALSHTQNLYFVATTLCVAVYEPKFPYQTLKRTPALVILPDVTRGDVTGAIPSSSPHAVNQLVVGQLGSQEILLLARDSGNVEAYNIAAICEAIKKIPEDYTGERNSLVLNVRPFFKQWVRQSAWGLAIHKEARMIAVSANIPSAWQPADSEDTSATITVFAFAVLPEPRSNASESSDGRSDTDEEDWIPWSSKDTPVRNRNYKIVLAGWHGHEHNIPNITFLNTSQESDSAWILSTDILGRMKMWHIWSQTCWRTWDFGHDTRRVWMGAPSYPGWQVVALDIGIFVRTDTTEEFIGASRAPIHHGNYDGGPSFDLSSIARRVPGRSQYHPAHPDADLDLSSEDDLDEVIDEQDDVLTSAVLIVDQEGLEIENLVRSQISRFGGELEYQIEDERRYIVPTSTEDSSTSSEGERQMPSPPPERSMRTNRLLNQMVTSTDNKTTMPPDIAILHCGNANVRLLGGPRAKYPHIFCAGILRQIFPNTRIGQNLDHIDRLNMVHTIPDLGIVLIATQAGRLAVCALTRRGDGLLGLRVDWILPTKKQELRGQRPEFCPLIGVAVGPIQGHYDDSASSDSDGGAWAEDKDFDAVKTTFEHRTVLLQAESNHGASSSSRKHKKPKKGEEQPYRIAVEQRRWKPPKDAGLSAAKHSRRWRVMLAYSDMSVLTYEISKVLRDKTTAQHDE